METTTKQQEILPAAQRAMIKEYGQDVTSSLLDQGCTCIADVKSHHLTRAHGEEATKRFAEGQSSEEVTQLEEGEEIPVHTEVRSSDFSDTLDEVCPKTPEEKNEHQQLRDTHRQPHRHSPQPNRHHQLSMTLSIPLSLGRAAVAIAVTNYTFAISVAGTDQWKAEGASETITYSFSFNFST